MSSDVSTRALALSAGAGGSAVYDAVAFGHRCHERFHSACHGREQRHRQGVARQSARSTGPNPQFAYETGGSGAAYRSSKAAVNALTVFYAQALASQGFKVNALAPGLRATNLNARAAASDGDPAEAAAAAVRLAPCSSHARGRCPTCRALSACRWRLTVRVGSDVDVDHALDVVASCGPWEGGHDLL
jgi:NAD(P)-dependent dehydrogenase (short-subunit alcohol dehydrogenase family)